MRTLEIISKKTYYDFFYIMIIVSVISIPLQVFAHEEESSKEILILSRFVGGDIETSTYSKQWSESFEKDFDSIEEHDISVKSLNNGTHVYFLLSWDDFTKGVNAEESDGAIIVFESKLESNKEHVENMEKNDEISEVWRWDASKPEKSSVIMDSTWEDQKWSVLFGRSVLTSEQNKIIFESGIKQEDFIKIAVWDGSEGESFDQGIDLPHADFILLPEIDTNPKDVFVWSALLVVGTVSFLFVERKIHYKKERSLNE